MGFDGYVYEITVAGTEITEYYAFDNEYDPEEVKHIWLRHMDEQDSIRSQLSSMWGDAVEVEQLGDKPGDRNKKRRAQRIGEHMANRYLRGY